MDDDAAPAAAAVPIAAVAGLSSASTLTEYFRNWIVRIRAGDTGALPVIGGLIILAVIFQALNANFLTAGNLVNLMVQGSVYMLFALGMIFVLLLGEIDLSIGFIGGVAGVVTALLVFGDSAVPWWIAVLAGLLCGAVIGFINGIIITTIGLPSFIVTLAGLLAWNGVMLLILGNGGTVPINDQMITNLANGLVDPLASWIVLAVLLVIYIADRILAQRRRKHASEPMSVTLLKIGGVVVAGIVVVWLCNVNRGRGCCPSRACPWVLLIVFFFAVLWTVVLSRTRFGTYVYAIGGNAEAARRAGISVNRIRVAVFTIAGFMGGVAGLDLRLAPAFGVDQPRWRHARALLHRCVRDRRHQPLWWPRQGDQCDPRRAGDRLDRQRHGSARDIRRRALRGDGCRPDHRRDHRCAGTAAAVRRRASAEPQDLASAGAIASSSKRGRASVGAGWDRSRACRSIALRSNAGSPVLPHPQKFHNISYANQ